MTMKHLKVFLLFCLAFSALSLVLAQTNDTPNSETPAGETPSGTDDRRQQCPGIFRNFVFRFRPRSRGNGEPREYPRDGDYGIGRQTDPGYAFPAGYDRQRFWRSLFYGNRSPNTGSNPTFDYPTRDEVDYL